jgi:hypothetical protein
MKKLSSACIHEQQLHDRIQKQKHCSGHSHEFVNIKSAMTMFMKQRYSACVHEQKALMMNFLEEGHFKDRKADGAKIKLDLWILERYV